MKTAIVIQNNACTGKSATVVAIYKELLHVGAKQLNIPIEIPAFSLDSGEVNAILEYKGKKIGIQSKGDPQELGLVVDAIQSFIDSTCEVIVSASRRQDTPNERTKTAILDLLSNAGYRLIETSQYHAAGSHHGILSNGVNVNQKYARAIADLVDQML